jgi:uncharacterized protein (TIGR01244 family)
LVAASGAAPPFPLQASQPPAPSAAGVPGVYNFTRVDSTSACGGALTLEAFGALRQAGYKSVVNLRDASEPGNDVEAAKKAAEAAGLNYIHLPFVPATPDMTMLDEFLKVVVKPENQPMLLHCTIGGRAAMFWAVKRAMIDGWSLEKAMGELPDLSRYLSQRLRTFMLDYLKARGKVRP